MAIVKRNSFETKAKELGLKCCNLKYWFLPGCDLMFSYNTQWGCIDACGVVPVDLSIELYKFFSKFQARTISNTKGFELKNPELDPCKVIQHESIDFNLIISKVDDETNFNKLWREQLEQALKEDYDNCYSDLFYIHSLKAFELFVKEVQAYYSRKKEQEKSSVYQLQE